MKTETAVRMTFHRTPGGENVAHYDILENDMMKARVELRELQEPLLAYVGQDGKEIAFIPASAADAAFAMDFANAVGLYANAPGAARGPVQRHWNGAARRATTALMSTHMADGYVGRVMAMAALEVGRRAEEAAKFARRPRVYANAQADPFLDPQGFFAQGRANSPFDYAPGAQRR